MIELIDKNTKTVLITVFCMFKKLAERMNIVSS